MATGEATTPTAPTGKEVGREYIINPSSIRVEADRQARSFDLYLGLPAQDLVRVPTEVVFPLRRENPDTGYSASFHRPGNPCRIAAVEPAEVARTAFGRDCPSSGLSGFVVTGKPARCGVEWKGG